MQLAEQTIALYGLVCAICLTYYSVVVGTVLHGFGKNPVWIQFPVLWSALMALLSWLMFICMYCYTCGGWKASFEMLPLLTAYREILLVSQFWSYMLFPPYLISMCSWFAVTTAAEQCHNKQVGRIPMPQFSSESVIGCFNVWWIPMLMFQLAVQW